MVPRKSSGGFTLIELMAVVVIVAVLLIVALPAYQDQIIRGHRAAAKAEMMDIASRERQFLLSDRAYASKATLLANGYALPPEVGARYDFSIDTTSLTSMPAFVITFTPDPDGTQRDDGTLTLNSEGVRTPADKWAR